MEKAKISNCTKQCAPSQEENKTNAGFILQELLGQGIISSGDVQKIWNMNRREKISTVHPYEIYQGKGKDKRWFTYIIDDGKENKRRKIARPTEEAMYDFLESLYKEQYETDYESITLMELYPEWRAYKDSMTNRTSYAYRITTDYRKFYVEEPLSQKILTTPLKTLNKIDMETWLYAVIKKHELTRKAYGNMSIILRQSLDYLVDKDVLAENIFRRIRVKKNVFKKVRKKEASTQIFYPDEVRQITETSFKLALQTDDEAYLAIPLFFESGMRLGECLGLRFSDCHERDNVLHLRYSMVSVHEIKADGTYGPRTFEIKDCLKHDGEERDILVTNRCFGIIRQVKTMLINKGIERERLFEVKTPASIEMKLYSICDELQIERRSPHKTRKTYISNLLNNGMDPDFVREQVGHKELKTTLNSYTYSTTRKIENLEKLKRIIK